MKSTKKTLPSAETLMRQKPNDESQRRFLKLEDLLIDCWDDLSTSIAAILLKHPKWEGFLIEFIANGGNAGEAYTMKINSHITGPVANAAGSAILRTKEVDEILKRVRQSKNESALIAIDTFVRGTRAKTYTKTGQQIEDTGNQIAAGESLAKMQGVFAPTEINTNLRLEDLAALADKRAQKE